MSIQFVDDVRDLLAQTFGLDVEAYTSLTTVEDETCFVTKAGGLMTALHLRGHLRVVGADELALLSDQLLSLLGSALAAGESHFIDLVYSSDPARTPAAIRRLLRPGTCTAERVGLDLRDLFAERERHLPAYTCAETAYLIVWTTPAGLPRATRRQSARERRRELARLPEKPALARDNQNPFATNRYLTDAHRSLVKTLLNDLAAAGFELSALPVAGAARRMREECDPGWTPDDWTPLLPGAATPAPRARADGSLAASGCWYPALGQQLIPRGIEIVDYRTVRVGDRLYQPFYIDVPQLTEMQRFERLLDRARRQGLPWRIAFRLSGGTAEWLAARRVWTSLLHFAGATNKLTDAALQALRRYLHEGHVGVKVQTALTTWVDLSEPAPPGRGHLEELRARAAHLAAHVQSWGGCTVRETTGHPVKAWVSTLPGVSQINVATCYAAPLAEVLRTLPLFRPASLWEAGAIVFRSRDGRLFAYQPGSAWQGTWNDLYYARPGSGKSVTMALVNLALILSPGFRELPFVRVIDIGPSSEGLVSLVREALPPARRFEAQFHAPSNDARWAINPLDTPLGLRRPPPGQRAFLVSFLSQLATAPGAIEPPEGVADMAGLVVDLAYEHYGDPKAPKPYAPAQDSAVDEALARHRVALPDRPSWWEVVDALFDAGDVPAAVRAQRHAVPLLSDLVAVAQSPQVAHIYGNEMSLSGTAESPVALFNRVISAATREWPILAYPSRFDLGNARVASLDVAALCGDMTPVGQRQTAIAYMLAMHVLSHDILADSSVAARSPARYRNHHAARAEDLLAYPKRMCLDEKHRCGGSRAVDAQIVRWQREGRKLNLHVALASQILDDFTPEMVELSTTVFVMEYSSDEMAEAARLKFSLSRSALAELRTHGTGPTPAGAPLLGIFRTKRGLIAQMLYLTTGPVELWALSTTPDDRVVRQRLYERFGPRRARQALARVYPGGTISDEVQRRLDGSSEGALARDTVLADLVKEVAAVAEAALAAEPADRMVA